jgi:hypothetical protein
MRSEAPSRILPVVFSSALAPGPTTSVPKLSSPPPPPALKRKRPYWKAYTGASLSLRRFEPA